MHEPFATQKVVSEKIAVGIIGLGRSGWDIHALGFEKNPRFRVVAVADPEAARRDEAVARFGCAAYATPPELLGDDSVELVVVATPSHTHGDLSCAASRAGKHVLVEKPMATSAEEARAMIACAQDCGKTLTVFQVRRMHGDFQKVREIIDSGVLGPLHGIKLSVYSYARRRDWQTLREFAGGMLNNFGTHFVDQALILAGGEWRDVFADMRHLVSAGDAEDHVKIVFRGENGVIIDVEMSSVAALPAPLPPHWTILGKYGALSGSLSHLNWRYYDPKAAPQRILDAATPSRQYEKPETLPWIEQSADIAPGDPVQQFYDHLFAFLRENAPSPAPPEEVASLIALFDACRQQCGFDV